jgi:hypothetical protein
MNSVRFSGIDIAYRIMWMWPLYFRSPANAHTNTVLWNAMINPFLRSTIFGALWYQGMSNIQHKKTCKNPYILKKWILQIKIIKTQFVILLVVNFVSHSGCICTCSNYCALNFKLVGLGLGLWCLTPLSTIIQLYRGGQFYRWMKPEYQEKNHRPVASPWQTLSHNVVSRTPRLSGIRTHNFSGDKLKLVGIYQV